MTAWAVCSTKHQSLKKSLQEYLLFSAKKKRKTTRSSQHSGLMANQWGYIIPNKMFAQYKPTPIISKRKLHQILQVQKLDLISDPQVQTYRTTVQCCPSILLLKTFSTILFGENSLCLEERQKEE